MLSFEENSWFRIRFVIKSTRSKKKKLNRRLRYSLFHPFKQACPYQHCVNAKSFRHVGECCVTHLTVLLTGILSFHFVSYCISNQTCPIINGFVSRFWTTSNDRELLIRASMANFLFSEGSQKETKIPSSVLPDCAKACPSFPFLCRSF